MKTLDCVEINPTKDAVGSVIWMHGLGADGNDFASIVPELNLPQEMPLRFIFPHAPLRPVTINNGYTMRAWFDIISLSNRELIDTQGIAEAVEMINQLIKKEIERGIPAHKIFLAGFSQGAMLALSTGLCYPQKLAGIIGLSGCLFNYEHTLATAAAANFTTPIFIAHGINDEVIACHLGQQTALLLEKNKYIVDFHRYPMGHSVCGEEIGNLADWMRKVFMV